MYIVGRTRSTTFPTTPGAFDTTYGGGSLDSYALKLNPSGSAPIYSTYLGGSDGDGGVDIEVDAAGVAYIVGTTTSTDFPTVDPLQTHQGGADVFVLVLTDDGSALQFGTYLGGIGHDYAEGIGFNANNIYVMGRTYSSDFPTLNPFQTDQGASDGFAARIALTPLSANVSFSSTSTSVSEDAGSHSIPITLSVTGTGSLASPFTVEVALSGTAATGIDYTPTGSSIPVTFTNTGGFTAGTYTQNVTLNLIDDTEVEGTESAIMTLSTPSDPLVVLGATIEHTVTVVDNDSYPTVTPILDNQPGFSVFDPAISKTGVLEPGMLGLPDEQITWYITVTGGGSSVDNAVITDTLPAMLRIDSVNSTKGTVTVNGQAVTCIIGELAPGEVVYLEILTTVLDSPIDGLITNTAIVNGGGISKSATAVINVVSRLPSTGYPPR